MTQLTRIADRYQAAAALAQSQVELYAVADETGAQFDAALRRLIAQLRAEDPAIWEELLAIARQFRWRLATDPAPARCRIGEEELARVLTSVCERRKHGSDDRTQAMLSELLVRAEQAHLGDRPTGPVLLESLADLNYEACVVIASSGRSQESIRQWFGELCIHVPVLCAGFREQTEVVEQAYAVGTPSRFGPALLSAPRARALAYLLPSWISDRALPKSSISDYAEGAIRPRRKIFLIGPEPVLDPAPAVVDDQLVPQPTWSRPESSRSLQPDEVWSRKVLLGGGLAMMLDQDGEHIRSLNPDRPPGKRIELGDVSAVTAGSYLVLREGSTQSEILYDRAIALLGDRGPEARASQEKWKTALRRYLERMGTRSVVRSLEEAGVRRADRAPAWTGVTMIRPQDDNDFKVLLRWLGLPLQPHYELATTLRRARLQASQDIREELENAVSMADLSSLERDGFLRLELDIPGFRSIIATRVLAVSPHLEPVHRSDVRRPFKDRGARWLG